MASLPSRSQDGGLGPSIPGKVFLGGLSQHTTDESLANVLSPYGPTVCKVMMDRHTGRSRGFGFVEFADIANAELLIMTRPLIIDDKEVTPSPCWDRDQLSSMGIGASPSDAPRIVPSGGGGGTPTNKALKMFVGGLSQNTTKETLNAYFSQFGHADSIVMIDRSTGRSRGFGFVDFGDEVSIQTALEMQTHDIDGCVVSCHRYAGGPSSFGKGGKGVIGSDGGGGLSAAVPSRGISDHIRVGHETASRDQNKIFVGGLSQATTKESLDLYFQQYGHADSYIMMDRDTGRSRGFGFVNFGDPGLMHTMLEMQHTIDGTVVTCSAYAGGPKSRGGSQDLHRDYNTMAGSYGRLPSKSALGSQPVLQAASALQPAQPDLAVYLNDISAKLQGALQALQQTPIQPQNPPLRAQSLKIFVGGLSQATTKDTLTAYFSQFGPASGIVMKDGATGRSRGFGFVDFQDEATVEGVLQLQHQVDGVLVACSRHNGKSGSGHAPPASQPLHNGGGAGAVASNLAEVLTSTVSQLVSQLQGLVNSPPQPAQQQVLQYQQIEEPYDPNKLYVGGLTPSTTSEMLLDSFSIHGPCYCEVVVDRGTGRSKGFGIVKYEEMPPAEAALMYIHVIDGVQVEVSEWISKFPRGCGGGGQRYSPY